MRIIILFVAAIMVSCGGDKLKSEETDLMSYGMPIKVNCPIDAEINSADYGLMKDITIKKGDNYYVQILSSDAIELDAAKQMKEELAQIKRSKTFTKIIQEDETGFIYEKMRSDSTMNYDFRQVRIQGDKKYIFQTGMVGKFELEDVKYMYKSVK